MEINDVPRRGFPLKLSFTHRVLHKHIDLNIENRIKQNLEKSIGQNIENTIGQNLENNIGQNSDSMNCVHWL